MAINPEEIVQLAMEVAKEDPIWDFLSIDEHNAFRLMALSVIELFENSDQKVMLATITKLVVENFILNLKISANINNQQSSRL